MELFVWIWSQRLFELQSFLTFSFLESPWVSKRYLESATLYLPAHSLRRTPNLATRNPTKRPTEGKKAFAWRGAKLAHSICTALTIFGLKILSKIEEGEDFVDLKTTQAQKYISLMSQIETNLRTFHRLKALSLMDHDKWIPLVPIHFPYTSTIGYLFRTSERLHTTLIGYFHKAEDYIRRRAKKT